MRVQMNRCSLTCGSNILAGNWWVLTLDQHSNTVTQVFVHVVARQTKYYQCILHIYNNIASQICHKLHQLAHPTEAILVTDITCMLS